MPRQNNIHGESQRLEYRKVSPDDFDIISQMLNSKSVQKVWEYEFKSKDIKNWVDKCLKSYKCGQGIFIIQKKDDKTPIGQVSLDEDTINGKIYYEIGYILKEEYTKKGYATEAAKYMVQHAFRGLNLKEVIFEIKPDNISSIKVAKRLGAKETGSFIKIVSGKKMPHLIFTIKNTLHK